MIETNAYTPRSDYELQNYCSNNMMLQSLSDEGKGYPYFKTFQVATTPDCPDVYRKIAERSSFKSLRLSHHQAFFLRPTVMARGECHSFAKHTTYKFDIWARGSSEISEFCDLIDDLSQRFLIVETMLSPCVRIVDLCLRVDS